MDPAPLTNDGAFDSAKAKTTIVETTDPSTKFTLRVTGIDPSAAGQQFAGHLHVGPCSNSGGHYQDIYLGPVDDKNEAWFAVVPDDDGMALSTTTVGWVPNDAKPEYATFTAGEMSIVIHKGPLLAPGPGPKHACFPLSVPQWSDGI